MNSIWQNLAVICVVLAASAYAARKIWLRFSSNSTRCCGPCRRCPDKPNTRQLITLDAPRSPGDD